MSDERTKDNARFAAQLVLTLLVLGVFSMFGFIVVPGLMGEGRVQPTLPSGHKAAAAGEGWIDPAEAPAEKGRDIPPVDPAEVLTPVPPLLARGKTLYASNCVPCHGEAGKGDGPSAATLNPKPRNFSDPAGWKNGSGLAGIYKTLTGGIKGSSMVAYDYLSPKDRMALVHFVRSLGTFDHGKDDPATLAALSAQFKTAGGRVPNHIPVSMAMWRLQAEGEGARPLVPPSGEDPERALFERAVADPARAAQVLSASQAWRSDLDALARAAAGGAPANGFKVSVATLAPGDWQRLQQLLVRLAGGVEEKGR
ncbi:MAG: c-type cytochrome [Myxococcaceae bacterium]